MLPIVERIANTLSIQSAQVSAAVKLIDEGATIPFIARYRKDVTGALDDGQLRALEERLTYFRELDARRESILNSIEEQGKLTPALKAELLNAQTKTQIEDLYLPYKPKRRTKGQIAIEAGIEPLADALYNDPSLDPEQEALSYLNTDAGFDDTKAVLTGAKYILMERFAQDAQLLEKLRNLVRDQGILSVSVIEDKKQEGEKFQDYFEYSEPLPKIPSHRLLAVLRGRNEGILRSDIVFNEQDPLSPHPCERLIAHHIGLVPNNNPADAWLAQVAKWTWSVKLSHTVESEIMNERRTEAESDAIDVFSKNLKDLLLAAPAGPRATLGLDPGYRSGVKVAVVGSTGKILDHCAVYPHQPQNQYDQAMATLAALCAKHKVELISIGNGTASRETDKLVIDMLKKYPELKLSKLVVSEAGASVYSASEFAAKEFPDLDVTIRGAISIARRLQDPLAELVKIDPKAIGVGQYQHDVNQTKLAKSLDGVVEDCVNGVGVDLNTASAPLLSRVSGITTTTANNIVDYREEHGAFKSRKQLLKVPRLGAKIFEQAAGFLRIMQGENPLDASCVHPEAYQIVEQMAKSHDRDIRTLIGDGAFLRSIDPKDYTNHDVGELYVKDILSELEKPGRDPRPEFKTAEFKEGVEKISDLKEGMTLEGVVTNVTNFGAFVDIGVHQDGLVHISALAYEFVKDPREVVKAGDVVKVKVISADVQRKRIALTMRLDDRPENTVKEKPSKSARHSSSASKKPQSQPSGAMADALKDLFKK